MRWVFQLWPRNPMTWRVPFKCPEWMPKVFWRRLIWAGRMSLVAYVIVLGLVSFNLASGSHSGLRLLIIGSAFLCLVLMWTVYPRVVLARFATWLRENDLLVCMECGYSLKGVSQAHTCPECGVSYEPEPLRNLWAFWLEHRWLPSEKSQKRCPEDSLEPSEVSEAEKSS